MIQKKMHLLAFFSFLYASLFAQTLQIPSGVTYSYTTEEINKKAQTVLTKEFGTEPNRNLFSGMLFIGPKLWTQIKDESVIKSISGGNTTFKLPVRNKRGKIVDYQNLKGKLIQTQNDYESFWKFLQENLIKGEFSFRKLKPMELEYYWSVISFDITEPIYIVTCNNKNYLFDLEEKDGKFSLLWVDAVDEATANE